MTASSTCSCTTADHGRPGTEVKMVPAARTATRLPLCTTATDAGPSGHGQTSGI